LSSGADGTAWREAFRMLVNDAAKGPFRFRGGGTGLTVGAFSRGRHV
jgi:hypothetical protein